MISSDELSIIFRVGRKTTNSQNWMMGKFGNHDLFDGKSPHGFPVFRFSQQNQSLDQPDTVLIHFLWIKDADHG